MRQWNGRTCSAEDAAAWAREGAWVARDARRAERSRRRSLRLAAAALASAWRALRRARA